MAETTTEIRTRTEPCYRMLASTIQARLNCLEKGNGEWLDKHTELLRLIEREILPRGSGIDSGTTIDLDRSHGERIVLTTPFHHMNESGMYDGWTDHTITIRASLWATIDITIGGPNRNQIKDYLGDVFHTVLMANVCETYDHATDTRTVAIVRE